MPDPEKLLAVAREWVAKAENDLKTAAHALTLKRACPTDTVCFHAQQVVEKYLKSVLVLNGIDFPKTHSLKVILSMLPDDSRPELTIEEQQRLTDYATGARYPGWPEISLKEARQAVVVARRVRREVRRLLPKAVLPLKRR